MEKGAGFAQGLVNIRELTPDHLLCLLGEEDDSFGVFLVAGQCETLTQGSKFWGKNHPIYMAENKKLPY